MTVTAAQRRQARAQAGNCCEYCRMHESSGTAPFHVDHIIAVKHGGVDHLNNLCFACYKCNAHKGDNVGGFDPTTDKLTRLYHPRQQVWNEYFEIRMDMRLEGLTPEGRTTVYVLRINDEDRIETRQILAELGEYPC